MKEMTDLTNSIKGLFNKTSNENQETCNYADNYYGDQLCKSQ